MVFSALSFGTPTTGLVAALLFIAQGVPLVLLLIACGNVAILLLARTANRSREIALRTALGASRSRIVGQLFVETLIMALLATGVGLLGLHMIVERVTPGIALPFWVDLSVTPEVVMKALGLGVASAVFAGGVPALRATGSSPQRTLQEAGGGGGAVRFGRVTGALIIAEVGLGVGALFAGGMTYSMFSVIDQETSVAMQPSGVLVASIDVPSSEQPREDRDGARKTRIARIASVQEALARQLAADPRVQSWAFSDATPGNGNGERRGRVEGETIGDIRAASTLKTIADLTADLPRTLYGADLTSDRMLASVPRPSRRSWDVGAQSEARRPEIESDSDTSERPPGGTPSADRERPTASREPGRRGTLVRRRAAPRGISVHRLEPGPASA